MPGERIASQSEVIRAIVSVYSPCLLGSRLLQRTTPTSSHPADLSGPIAPG